MNSSTPTHPSPVMGSSPRTPSRASPCSVHVPRTAAPRWQDISSRRAPRGEQGWGGLLRGTWERAGALFSKYIQLSDWGACEIKQEDISLGSGTSGGELQREISPDTNCGLGFEKGLL